MPAAGDGRWVGGVCWMEAAPHPRVRVAGPWPLAVSLAELSHSGRICPLVPGMGFMDLTTAHRAVDLLLTQFCWNFRNFESSVIHLCLKHDPSSVARLCLFGFFFPAKETFIRVSHATRHYCWRLFSPVLSSLASSTWLRYHQGQGRGGVPGQLQGLPKGSLSRLLFLLLSIWSVFFFFFFSLLSLF